VRDGCQRLPVGKRWDRLKIHKAAPDCPPGFYDATLEEVLREYPNLAQEDITQALAYTAWLAHEEVHPV